MDIPGFIGATYRQTALEIDVEDTVNFFVEFQESPGAKAKAVLYGSPGLVVPPATAGTATWQIGNGPIRGLLDLENWTHIVSGDHYFRLRADGTWDPGAGGVNGTAIANDGLPVSFASDTTQVLFTSAGIAYVHNASGVNPVATFPWARAADCAMLDGYFIVLDDSQSPIGGQFFVSAIRDATTWNALDFSTSPSSNNKLLALATDHDELWVFGSKVTQPFYNPGTGALFPFQANQTAVVMQGIQAKNTRVNLDNTLFWLGRNEQGIVQAFQADGYSPKRISTHPIEQQWNKYQNPSDATSWVYQLSGHPTLHINFNTDQASWRFDNATKLWHRVAYRNTITDKGVAHRGNCHCMRNGMHLVGDRLSNQIWQLSPSAYTDGPDPLVALRRAPGIWKENKTIFYKLFELITQYGIGDGSLGNPTSNPAWMLRWSNDNGNTWSNEYQLTSGTQGQYSARVRKVGCGASLIGRTRVFEVSISAAVPRALIGAEVEIEIGKS